MRDWSNNETWRAYTVPQVTQLAEGAEHHSAAYTAVKAQTGCQVPVTPLSKKLQIKLYENILAR